MRWKPKMQTMQQCTGHWNPFAGRRPALGHGVPGRRPARPALGHGSAGRRPALTCTGARSAGRRPALGHGVPGRRPALRSPFGHCLHAGRRNCSSKCRIFARKKASLVHGCTCTGYSRTHKGKKCAPASELMLLSKACWRCCARAAKYQPATIHEEKRRRMAARVA